MTADTSRPAPATFRQRFRDGAVLHGSFIKTPTGHAIEILGDVGFDFVVIDAEHAPFDRASIDIALLAARAAGVAGLVRVPSAAPDVLLAALDCGAAGVIIPHVASVETARDVVAACRYRGGRRGFSNSPRAGRYGGLGMWAHIDAADAATTVIATIEDPGALDVLDAIATTDGIDGFFIGRADLTVAMGAPGPDAPEVRDAVERIVQAARRAQKPALAMVGRPADAGWLRELGVSAFILSSDQGFLRQAAAEGLAALAGAKD